MKQKEIAYWQTIFYAGCLLLLSALCILTPAKAHSESERRPLAQFPDLNLSSLTSGRFMEDFEDYSLDQFPLREGFRSLKALSAKGIFQQQDLNGLYEADGTLIKMEYPLNQASLDHACSRFQWVYDSYLKNTKTKVYCSVIPDKNAFWAEETGHLSMDYGALYASLQQQMPYAAYLDLASVLSAENYYATDTHWKQETLVEAAQTLAQGMGAEIAQDYKKTVLDTPFYGVYAGQYALPVSPDSLCYLHNEVIDNLQVYDHQNEREIPVYDLSSAQGKDPYELFLSGPLSLISIENPLAETDRELIVFRDSFGSSIAPLLATGYAKLTLVDIRYLPSTVLGSYLEFSDQDVLFLYSSLILNSSAVIK